MIGGRHLLLIGISIACQPLAYSQKTVFKLQQSQASKPPLDTSALKNWTQVNTDVHVTGDGQFIMYAIEKQSINYSTIVLRSLDGRWQKEFMGDLETRKFITKDDKWGGIFGHDTLLLQSLGKDQFKSIPNIESFDEFKIGADEWLDYRVTDQPGLLTLVNLSSGREMHFENIADFVIKEESDLLLLKIAGKPDSLRPEVLKLLNLNTSALKQIWSGDQMTDKDADCGSFVFDAKGDRLAFIVQQNRSGIKSNQLWLYQQNWDKAVEKQNDESLGFDKHLSINNDPPSFSHSSDYILFHVTDTEHIGIVNPNAAKVDIWSYKDKVLQSVQSHQPEDLVVTAVVSVENGNTFLLEQPGEHIEDDAFITHGDYVIVSDNSSLDSHITESGLPDSVRLSFRIVFFQDGSRKLLFKGLPGSIPDPYFAPSGRYIIYFDNNDSSYKSYEVSTGSVRKVSKGIPTRLVNERIYLSGKLKRSPVNQLPVGCWFYDSTTLLIYDNFDMWAIDASGLKGPICVTHGYGQKQGIQLRLRSEQHYFLNMLSWDLPLVVNGFKVKNKENGLFWISMTDNKDPEPLEMGPYKYSFVRTFPLRDPTMSKGEVLGRGYVIGRESPEEPFNLFFTRDFRVYDTITNIRPQSSYNWLTAELVKWRQADGRESEGILFKPENFDKTKRYPVIFHYYEQYTDNLFQFPFPDLCYGDINVPWFVSHGYLVFEPDLFYSAGHVGESVKKIIESAATYLSAKPWVDGKHLGLNGHSFGGFETYYLVTHSHLFAAAAAGEGVTDLVSSYGQLRGLHGFGASNQRYFESSQGRIGATLWERPDLYIKESPIFYADQVSTPLLMMDNKLDGAVSFDQGLELFLGLRRLGKKVWMLQYDGEGHILTNQQDVWDFTTRISQFFDYYLKGARPPKWMTVGVPARLKGVDPGFEFDESAAIP